MNFTDTLVSTIIQLAVFIFIPFVCFFFRKNKSQSLFQYIGFTKPTAKSVYFALAVALIFVAIGLSTVFLNDNVRKAQLSEKSVAGNLRQTGFNFIAIITLLINALIKTSLGEEILFRGFIARQLAAKSGFTKGNLIQALIFGFIHFLLFGLLIKNGWFAPVFIFIFSTLAAWLIGYNMFKNAKGSIIPGWIGHGLGNTVSYFLTLVAFPH